MNTLFLWDSNKVEQAFRHLDALTPDAICSSLEELKTNKFLPGKDAVIMLLETDIDHHLRNEFYGLEIIKILRKELRYRGVIIAYSFCHENYFRSQKNTEILFTSGTWLKRLPRIDTDEIAKLIESFAHQKLSDDLLDDISFSVFDNKGKVHEYLHNLKNDLNIPATGEDLESIIARQTTILDRCKKLLQKEVDPQKMIDLNRLWTELVKEIIADIKENRKNNPIGFPYTNAGNQVSKYSNQIAELVPVSGDNTSVPQGEKINWEVLFFDDKQDVREIVSGYFETKNVICHLAATEDEVYQKLKDNGPKISLFISDIRLLDENGHWCHRQGYDVIEQVNETNDSPLVYAVLTSKKGTINKMVQKKRRYEIFWFTKDDVINSIHSFNIFFDLVKVHADENFNSNTVFQPSYSAWNFPSAGFYTLPLKLYYKKHREIDHATEEANINKMTMEWVFDVGAKKDWTAKLLKKAISEYDLRKFRETKLLGRRVALALAAYHFYSGKTIYVTITQDSADVGSEEKFKSRMKQFYTRLALPNNPEKLIHEAIGYYKGEGSTVGIIYEEYEFLKNEFFEEQFIDSIKLGHEREGLKVFIQKIEQAFTARSIPQPRSFERILSILDNDGFPKAERLDVMFAELKELNEQSSYKLLKGVGNHTFLSSVTNELIKELLKKYEWI